MRTNFALPDFDVIRRIVSSIYEDDVLKKRFYALLPTNYQHHGDKLYDHIVTRMATLHGNELADKLADNMASLKRQKDSKNYHAQRVNGKIEQLRAARTKKKQLRVQHKQRDIVDLTTTHHDVDDLTVIDDHDVRDSTHMYARTYHTCTHAHTHSHTPFSHTHTHMHTCTHAHAHMHTCTCTHQHVHVHAQCTHARVYRVIIIIIKNLFI